MKIRLALPWVLLSMLSGCAALQEFLGAAVKEPTFTFRGTQLNDVSLGGLTLDTIWVLNNPNVVGLNLAAVDYALFVEGKQVVAGTPQNGLQIPAQGSVDLHFPANIQFADLTQVVQTLLAKENASWRVEGHLGVQTPLGIVRLPIAQEGTFEVPRLPTVEFGNPRISSLTFQGATIEFPLVVTNRNSYALPIAGITGALAIAGSPVGTLSTGNLGALDGKGVRQISLPLQLNLISTAGAVTNALRGGNAQVTFNAQVQSGTQTVPLKIDQLLRFSQ